MEKLNLDKKTLRKFAITMGIAFLVITVIIFIRHRHNILPTSIISVIFFALAVIMPIILKPVYILWMRLAFILSWINTRLILLIIFYLIFTPISLAIKLFGVDLLDIKINKQKGSYWRRKEKKIFNPLDYERQF